jgi:hypothetical protein
LAFIIVSKVNTVGNGGSSTFCLLESGAASGWPSFFVGDGATGVSAGATFAFLPMACRERRNRGCCFGFDEDAKASLLELKKLQI